MGDRIEKLYLLGKLNEVIEIVVEADKKFPIANSLPAKFKDLKTILQTELENSTITPSSSSSTTSKLTKENLYTINNLLCEWQSKQNFLDTQFFAYTCGDLDKVLEEINPKIPTGETIQHQAEKTIEEPTEHQAETTTEEPTEHQAETTIEAYRWSNQFVVEKTYGIEDMEVSLRRLILAQPPQEDSTAFRMFGLVGMRGIGKTVLAQRVFNHTDVRSHFLIRVWVCVSKQPDDDLEHPKMEIVMRVLRSLGLEEEVIRYARDSHQLKGLLYSLRQQLSGKRYLIVLDDVYLEDEEYLKFVSTLEKNIENCEESLGYGLPKEYGGAVIVTSRSKDIAGRLVGEENLHRVLHLSDDDCWEIFKNHFKENEEEKLSGDMESLKKKITEKCHGLPLAAKMMGEIAKKNKRKQKNRPT